MAVPEERINWSDIIRTAIPAFLLMMLRVYPVFLIPLYLLASRRGLKSLIIAAVLTASAFFAAGYSLAGTMLAEYGVWQTAEKLVIPDLLFVVLLTAAAVLTEIIKSRVERSLYRILIIGSGLGFISLTVLYVLGKTGLFEDVVKLQQDFVNAVYNTAVTLTGEELQADAAVFRKIFLGCTMVSVVLILAANWRIAQFFIRRRERRNPFSLTGFFLPEKFIWPLMFSWAGVLADRIVGLGFFGYLLINTGWIFLFIYILNGFGILRYLTENGLITGLIAIAVAGAAVLTLIIPGLYIVLIVGVCGLGVSEVWIKYRNFQRREDK